MRRLVLLLLAVAALAAPGPAAAATKIVSISRTAFSPSSVTIQTGDTVTWRNSDSQRHQVVASSGAFASPVLAQGRIFSVTFNRPGTFRYHDGLHPQLKGRVVVRLRPPPPWVTLGVSNPIVRYGDATRLYGVVSSRKPNEIVQIFARESGQLSYVLVATLMTGVGGFWAYDVRPRVTTSYQVRFRNVVSGELVVQVRPRLRLLATRRFFFASVSGLHSFAGRFIILQRLTVRGTWASVRSYRLGRRSGRLFRVPRRTGVFVYRVYMTAAQAGAGYLDCWSGTQRVARR
jgi:plastocyanin